MEYVAAGDVSPEGVHLLSTGGMLAYARDTEHEVEQHDAGRAHAGRSVRKNGL